MMINAEDSKKGDLHGKIVDRVLPRFAEKLKREGIISNYDRKFFMIRLVKGWPVVRIDPDLVLYLYDKKKVLVEIANPKDPKRFIGEMVYAQLLGYFKQIAAVIIFVLHPVKGAQPPIRSTVQSMILHLILKKQIPSIVIGWSEDHAYWNLKLLYLGWVYPTQDTSFNHAFDLCSNPVNFLGKA